MALGLAVAGGLSRVYTHRGLKPRHAENPWLALQLEVDCYYLDHDKTWPTNLQQLVPEYTDRIPRDPWGYDYQLSVLSDGTRKVRSPGLEQLRTAGNHTNVSITKPRGAE